MLVDINQAELAFKEQFSPDVDLSAFTLFVQYKSPELWSVQRMYHKRNFIDISIEKT